MKYLIENLLLLKRYITSLLFTTSILLTHLAYSMTYTVTSNANTGANTLRQAITDANLNPGADIIEFNFGGVTTITLTTCLPQITGEVLIDGYSNPAASAGNLMIEVISPAGCNDFDFRAGSNNSTIRGIVISGGTNGIFISACSGHVVKGNYIGTNSAGTAIAAARLQNCISLDAATNITIGGVGGQIERNILSGATQDGIRVANNSTGMIVINNYIGTDYTGNVGLGNTSHGIEGYGTSHNARVGGTTFAEQNVISANGGNGIYFNTCQSVVVKGNTLGMGVNGTAILGNGGSGIDIQNTTVGPPQIGGLTLAERNYSSCNNSFGAVVRHAPGSIFEGNWFGVDKATGNLDYGNRDAGITVTNSADVRVGGSVLGSGNVLSANGNPGAGADGISIWSTSPRPIIKGNIIGLGVDGITSLQNYGHGIECLTCDNGIIGGPTLLERNLVASSFNVGMQLVNSPGITVLNNYVGTDITGLLDRGGSEVGIRVDNSINVIIGTGLSGEGNIISGNAQHGILIGGSSSGTIVKGNIIGLGSDGSTVIRNDESGIRVSSDLANNLVIGGASVDERNIVSGNGVNNGHHAISVDGLITGLTIINNYVGTDITGSLARGNTGTGIFVSRAAVTIDNNISSSNGNRGIELTNITPAVNITRNKVGTDVSGTLARGNGTIGIRISATNPNNIIGGSLANANIIANNNAQAGVWLEPNVQRNTITYNSIYCNAGLGIELEGTSNESVLPPGITLSGANAINGTGVDGNIIHVYRNQTGDGGVKCNCEGEIYIGTTTVAGGVWSLTHNLGLSAAAAASVTATQTTINGSTSEFTPCSSPLPIQLTSFIAKAKNTQEVLVSWSVSLEKNNNYYEVLRSEDGIHFTVIGIVNGHGNYIGTLQYSFVDEFPNEEINYYRLRQVDFNNEYSWSPIRQVNFSEKGISIIPKKDGFSIVGATAESPIFYKVYTMNGMLAAEGNIYNRNSIAEVKLALSNSMYIVYVSSEGEIAKEKIIIME